MNSDPRLLHILDRILGELGSERSLAAGMPSGNPLALSTLADLPSDEEWADVDISQLPANDAELADDTKKLPDYSPHDLPHVTLLPIQCTLVGDLQIRSTKAEIHGMITGNIEAPADGELIVGKQSVINGNIRAGRLVIQGLVYGQIEAVKLSLSSGSVLHGDVCYQTNLIIDDGAELDGSIRRVACIFGETNTAESGLTEKARGH